MAKRRKVTQKELIFYILYKRFKEKNPAYMPVFAFMGEHEVKELDIWGFVSHECSARASDLRRENPELFEHQTTRGKSGARYFSYRINPRAKPEMIKDPALAKFYARIRRD